MKNVLHTCLPTHHCLISCKIVYVLLLQKSPVRLRKALRALLSDKTELYGSVTQSDIATYLLTVDG